jgi:hypothetical protein
MGRWYRAPRRKQRSNEVTKKDSEIAWGVAASGGDRLGSEQCAGHALTWGGGQPKMSNEWPKLIRSSVKHSPITAS